MTNSMRRFSEIIEDLELRDTPCKGVLLLRGEARIIVQCPELIVFLVSNDWESYFSGVIQSTLPRPISDHCPILLDAGGIRKGPTPF